MQLLKGKPVADKIKEKTAAAAARLLERNVVPTLGILRVGANESDVAYENSAVKAAAAVGLHVEKFIMPADSKGEDVLDVLKVMNEDANIHGILLFRPLPKSMDEDLIRNHVAPQKDVDGISDASLGGLFTGERRGFPPCTAEAAMAILDYYGIETAGRHAVVIGRSLVAGKPAAMMLLERNAAVTICHSKIAREKTEALCREADIVISAVGKIAAVGAGHVNPAHVIVDVGINFDEDGRMCGDVDAEAVEGRIAALTPVPGGVGSVTTALLTYHVVQAAQGAVDEAAQSAAGKAAGK